MVSVIFSLLLSLAIYQIYFGQHGHDYYSTDGVTPPVALTSMDAPNNSAYPLLANDQNIDNNTRALPH